jgi:hypothetical protein
MPALFFPHKPVGDGVMISDVRAIDIKKLVCHWGFKCLSSESPYRELNSCDSTWFISVTGTIMNRTVNLLPRL